MPAFLLIIIIIFLMLALIFLAPVRISLKLAKNGPFIKGSYKIGWLGITLHKGEISPPTLEEMMKAPDEGTEKMKAKEMEEREAEERLKAEKKRKKASQLPAPSFKDLMEALPAMTRVFRNLIESINVETISCRVFFGLNDPADTAVISGYLWSIASVIGLYRGNIYIEPYFEGERLDGCFFTDIKARLLWIALSLVKALREEKIRRLIIETARRGVA